MTLAPHSGGRVRRSLSGGRWSSERSAPWRFGLVRDRGDRWCAAAPAEGELVAVEPHAFQAVLHEGEIVLLWLRPAKWWLARRAGRSAFGFLLAVGGIVGLAARGNQAMDPLRVALMALAALLLAHVTFVVLDWSVRRYVLTDRRVLAWGMIRRMMGEMPLPAVRRLEVHTLMSFRPSDESQMHEAAAGSIDFVGPSGELGVRWEGVALPHRTRRIVEDAIRRYARGRLDGG